ncbi:MAG: type II secretion system protein [Victivallales bacterium]|nr:type II secretion system protein [Victivallales bacterium]
MDSKKPVSRPYSLVEMLVVMAVIAILVGLGAGGYSVARRWLAQSRTEALVAKLKLAIEAYKNDKGYYPLPQGTVTNFRLDANVGDFTGSVSGSTDHLQPRNNMSKFMDYSKLRHDQSYKFSDHCSAGHYTGHYVKDAWNTGAGGENYGPIRYECPGSVNTTSFDLYSAGYDRIFNTSDDIRAK